jgi:hypothetical protein
MLLNVVVAALWMGIYKLIEGDRSYDFMVQIQFNTFWMLLVTICFLGPLVEELLFRFPLRYERNYLLHLFLLMLGGSKDYTAQDVLEKIARERFDRYFGLILYGSSVLFAFTHVFNFPGYSHLLIWFPLLTLVQFVLGLIVSYLRIRFGFLWGLYYHIVYNSLIFGSAVLILGIHPWNGEDSQKYTSNFQQDPPDWLIEHYAGDMTFEIGNTTFTNYHVDNAEYSLTIERDKDVKSPSGYGVTPNKIFFDWTTVQYALRTLSCEEVIVNDPDSIQLFVELHMKKSQHSATKARNILEKELVKALSLK